MKTNHAAMLEIERLFQEYEKEIVAAEKAGYLKPKTTHTYLLHSGNFVKWCKNEFEPGGRNKNILDENKLE